MQAAQSHGQENEQRILEFKEITELETLSVTVEKSCRSDARWLSDARKTRENLSLVKRDMKTSYWMTVFWIRESRNRALLLSSTDSSVNNRVDIQYEVSNYPPAQEAKEFAGRL